MTNIVFVLISLGGLMLLIVVAGSLVKIGNAMEALLVLAKERQIARAAIELKASQEATEYFELQKVAVQANIDLVTVATSRLDAEREHIARCEERYARSLFEAEQIADSRRQTKPTKPKAH